MSRLARLDERRRGAEVDHCLDSLIGRRPRALPGSEDAPFAPGLPAALTELGPVFAAFGRDLASRADLFHLDTCRELARVEPPSTPLCTAETDSSLEQAFGVPPETLFSNIEAAPFARRWPTASYRARLRDGRPVEIRLVPKAAEELIARDLPHLHRLHRAFGAPLDEPIADFRASLAEQLDLAHLTRAFATLARYLPAGLSIPRTEPGLAAAKALVLDHPEGRSLQAIATGESLGQRRELARRLSLSWLQMLLAGRLFPIESTLSVLPSGALVLNHGRFGALSDDLRTRFWNYLRAVKSHHPDHAADELIEDLEPGERSVSVAELRLRFRQLVPFRDGSWSKHGESIAEYAMLQWRTATRSGYHFPSALRDAFRGLFDIARLGHRLDPEGDPLADGLDSLQWLASWSRLRELSDPSQAGVVLEGALTGWASLPQRLEHLERSRFRSSVPARPSGGRRGDTAALALLMATVVSIGWQLREVSAAVEPAATVIFLLLGALFVREVLR